MPLAPKSGGPISSKDAVRYARINCMVKYHLEWKCIPSSRNPPLHLNNVKRFNDIVSVVDIWSFKLDRKLDNTASSHPHISPDFSTRPTDGVPRKRSVVRFPPNSIFVSFKSPALVIIAISAAPFCT